MASALARAPRLPVAGTLALALGIGALAGALAITLPDLFHLSPRLSASHLLALAAGLTTAVLLVYRPTWALVALVALVQLNLSEVLVRFHSFPSTLQLLAVPAALAAWRVARSAKTTSLMAHPIPWLAAAWCLTLAVSSTWALEPAHADLRALESAKGVLVLVFVGVLASSSLRRFFAAIVTALAAASALALIAGAQVATGRYDQDFGGLARVKQAHIYGDIFEPRIAGPLGDPNFFAQSLLVLVPVALLLGWYGARRHQRLASWVAAGLLVCGTVLTYSRGGALALATGAALAYMTRGPRLRELAAGVLVLFLVVPLLPHGFWERLGTLKQFLPGQEVVVESDGALEKRRLVTRTAWVMFLDHPFVGVGAGNYGDRFLPYSDRVGSDAREYDPFERRFPHSLYLEIAAETGLVGLTVFGLLVLTVLASAEGAIRRFARQGLGTAAMATRGLQLGLLAYLVSSLFLHAEFERYLWLLAGLVLAADLLSRASGSGPQGLTRSPEAAW